jgi:hypothetical protein
MFERWTRRFMEAAGADGGAGGGGAVTYDFGKDIPADQVPVLTEHAKSLGLTAEQAPKYAAHYAAQTKAQAEAAAKANALPAEYKFDQVDGKDLDPELVKELSATAKELGLNAEQAKKFAAYELGLRKSAGDADKEQLGKLKVVQDGWKAEIAKDPELGGAKLEESKAIVQKALTTFFPEVAKNEAGFPFLDHPQVFRGLALIGKAIGPDGDFVRTPGKGDGSAAPEQLLYPTMFPQK